jgi:hypothetical protein
MKYNGSSLNQYYSITRKVFEYFDKLIPNPDHKPRSQGISAYKETEKDPIVKSCFNIVVDSVAALEWSIVGTDSSPQQIDTAYKIFETLFKRDFRRVVLKAINYGIQFIDLIWNNDSIRYPEEFAPLPHEYLYFKRNEKTGKNELWALTKNNPTSGELVPEYKIFTPTIDATYDNPYGVGALYYAFKSVFIKQNAVDFWAILLEDHGQPKVDAEISDKLFHFMRNTLGLSQENIIGEIQTQIETLRQNGYFTHFEGLNIKTLESGITDKGTSHHDLATYCDDMIRILYLGHTGAGISTPGRLGSEQAAMKVLDIRATAYIDFLENACNNLLNWINQVNGFSNPAPRIVFFEKDDLNKYKEKLEVVKGLRECGLNFSEDYYAEEFNLDKSYFELKEPVQPTNEKNDAELLKEIYNIFPNLSPNDLVDLTTKFKVINSYGKKENNRKKSKNFR